MLVLGGIDDVEDRMFIATVLYGGMRVGEIVKCLKRDLLTDNIMVRKTKVREGGVKYRVVLMCDKYKEIRDFCLPMLRLRKDDHVFTNRYGYPLSRGGANHRVKKYFGDYETCHTLRKTIGNRVCGNNVGLADGENDYIAAMLYLGHKSLASTFTYLDTSQAYLENAINKRL